MKRHVIGLLTLCFIFLNLSTGFAGLNDGLIAYYPFNGDTLDHSGNGRNGIAYGGTTYTTGVDGNLNSAYQFDGVNDYIKIAHHTSLNISGDFSISFWATRDLASGTQVILAKGRDCSQSYFFGWSGPARFNLNPTTSCPGMTAIGTAFPLQEWHFVTTVVDNTNLKLRYYLDGVLVSEKSLVRSIISNTYPLVIGRHFTAANGTGGYEYYFNGKIDELRLYNRILSDEDIQELYHLSDITVTITNPKLPSVQKSGDQVLIAWESDYTLPSDKIMISMKRASVPPSQTTPDGINWHQFVLADDINDGYETVTIPTGVAEANDWNFYVKHIDSEKWDSTDQVFEIINTKRNWGVLYISQKDYSNNMKESACGPTSIAMLLQYYYPNSQIDMPVVYHAGTQMYTYEGPAIGYRNLSFQGSDTGIYAILPEYRTYVGNSGDSRGNISYFRDYLQNTWGIQSNVLSTAEEVYTALEVGPVLGQVYAHGNTSWGHFVVIRGIDDNFVYINDPYDTGWGFWDSEGQDKAISYQDFFTDTQKRCGTNTDGTPIYCYEPWFRNAYQLTPQDSAIESLYSLVVDTGHNDFEGYANPHVFTLFNENEQTVTGDALWKFYYGAGGDWYYPEKSGQSARWTPELAIDGYYRVEARYRADKKSGIVTYSANYFETITTNIDQELDQNSEADYEWRTSVIVDSMYLGAGCYVEATNIPAGTNIDTIKFTFLHQ